MNPPDSMSQGAQDYSSLEEALQRSGLMTTDDWPARHVRTLAQVFRQHAHVAEMRPASEALRGRPTTAKA